MKSILFLSLFFLNMLSFAQDRSIQFETTSFKMALDKARENDKLLFVDCYTSWCGPCKMLAKDVFTNNEVADYFNKNFVAFKVDCEKGEGPGIAKQYGVSGYPTLLFLDTDGNLVNKIVGATAPAAFLEKVKKGLDPETSLYGKEKRYKAGERDRAFVLDLIESYKAIREIQKARQVSLELLPTLSEQELLTKEMWNVVRYYYVSTYGSEWWNFILKHKNDYIAVVGEKALRDKVGETLHPYLFSYSYGRKKAGNRKDFETYKALVDEYQPRQKGILYSFIKLGESASFDNFNGYFKSLLKVVPEMDLSEHYRFFVNALDFLVKNVDTKQKQQLLALLKDSEAKQSDYFKPLYQKFYDKLGE